MTEFERIKAMNVVEFAVYLNKMQLKAIDDYENRFFPKGVFENVAMLEREVTETLEDKMTAAAGCMTEGLTTDERTRIEPFAER